jgi:DNA-binding transcriptional regulator YiaG
MGKCYYSEASMVCHQSAKDLFEIGAISEAEMKEFDDMCFVKEKPEMDYTTEKPTVMKHVNA